MNAVPAPLRQDLTLALTAFGVIGAMDLPAIWLVAGGLSAELFYFTVLYLFNYALTAVVEVLALRLLAPWVRSRPAQLLIAAGAGVAFMPMWPLSADGHAIRLGLLEAGGSAYWTGVWVNVLMAMMIVVYRAAHERHAAAVQRLKRVQQAQLATRRELVDGQLRAVQARIDPGQFFAALEAIEQRYEAADPARAEALFEALVRYLRAAIPRAGEGRGASSSTLGAELELADACAVLHRLATGQDVTLRIVGAEGLAGQAFPPGVLLPLVVGALPAAGAAQLLIRVQAAGPAELHLDFEASQALEPARLQQADESLRALYGAPAALQLLPASRLRIAIPREGEALHES